MGPWICKRDRAEAVISLVLSGERYGERRAMLKFLNIINNVENSNNNTEYNNNTSEYNNDTIDDTSDDDNSNMQLHNIINNEEMETT